MRLFSSALVLLRLSKLIRGEFLDDVYNGPSHKWRVHDKTVYINNDDVTNVFVMHTATEESWGSDLAPWELVETLKDKCPADSCNMNFTYPSMVQLEDNTWPVPHTLNVTVEARFEEKGTLGTKKDMFELMSVILQSLHDPLTTEHLFYKTVDGSNTTSIGYRPVYTAPKVISVRVNNKLDDHLVMPHLQVRIASGRRKRSRNTMCEHSRARARQINDAVFHRWGTDLRIYRIACVVPALPYEDNQ